MVVEQRNQRGLLTRRQVAVAIGIGGRVAWQAVGYQARPILGQSCRHSARQHVVGHGKGSAQIGRGQHPRTHPGCGNNEPSRGHRDVHTSQPSGTYVRVAVMTDNPAGTAPDSWLLLALNDLFNAGRTNRTGQKKKKKPRSRNPRDSSARRNHTPKQVAASLTR